MTRFSLFATAAFAGCSLLLTACSRESEAPPIENEVEAPAEVALNESEGQPLTLAGGDGLPLGSVMVGEGAGGVTLSIEAMGMPEGTHGLHLHEKGVCEGPKFESAGGHWNPGSKKHGRDNPEGAHLGDLDNLVIPASGAAAASLTVAGGTQAAMADADGTSLVVHAKADDYKTDPSGDSGDRIACVVLAPPTGS